MATKTSIATGTVVSASDRMLLAGFSRLVVGYRWLKADGGWRVLAGARWLRGGDGWRAVGRWRAGGGARLLVGSRRCVAGGL